MFGVTILGNNSALPAYNRHPAAQIITLNDHLFLIDCGEGTQMQMNLYRIKRSRINHIFISHLHGDHYFGLPGLVTSYGLLHRSQPLHIYAPEPLKNIIEMQLKVSDAQMPYPLHFHTLEGEQLLVDEENYSVESFKVFHRIDCWGFIFREKRKPRKINIDTVKANKIPVEFFEKLQMGEDYFSNGVTISNEVLTFPNKPSRSYAYSADTMFKEELAEKIKHVDVLFHEATYLEDKLDKAISRYHSTAGQAAMQAKLAEVKKLIIGHFSSSYEKLDDFLLEAKAVFPNVELALEGETFIIT